MSFLSQQSSTWKWQAQDSDALWSHNVFKGLPSPANWLLNVTVSEEKHSTPSSHCFWQALWVHCTEMRTYSIPPSPHTSHSLLLNQCMCTDPAVEAKSSNNSYRLRSNRPIYAYIMIRVHESNLLIMKWFHFNHYSNHYFINYYHRINVLANQGHLYKGSTFH